MTMRKYNPLISPMNSSLMDLPSPGGMSYLWNYGSLLGFCLSMQMLTGVMLAMHYSSHPDMAFLSISHMMSDVNYGWLMSYSHANGASLFFVCIYIHMASGIYYGSYLSVGLWFSGVLLYVCVMATAFLGYVLPWGQMSFWGATVMTNFFSAMPYMGDSIVLWLWGGFSVSGATLTSFYSLHYLLPFLMMSLVLVHLMLLHEEGSSSPLGLGESSDKVPFHPYYIVKDFFGFLLLILMLVFLVFFYPNYLGDPENFMSANPLVTPVHILPEWYYLYAYAILSAMPNKLGGFLALVCAIVILLILPVVHTSVLKSLTFSPVGKIFFWLFMSNFILLTWLGGKPVDAPFVEISMMSGLTYFLYFTLMVPVTGFVENYLVNEYISYISIS